MDDFITIKMINGINCGENDLNNKCGAEHVHKLELLPKNITEDDFYGVSVDGDADRLIYFINH